MSSLSGARVILPPKKNNAKNLMLSPANVSSADWAKLNLVITNDVGGAPFPDADKVSASAIAGLHFFQQNGNLSAPSKDRIFTGSVFVKPAEYSQIDLGIQQASYSAIRFDSATGNIMATVVGGNTVLNSGSFNCGNGWYRVFITVLMGPANLANYAQLQIVIRDATGAQNYLGDGVSGIYCYGMNLTESSNLLPLQL